MLWYRFRGDGPIAAAAGGCGVTGATALTDVSGVYSFLAPQGTHTLSLEDENGNFKNMALAPVSGVGVSLPGPMMQNITMSLATTGSTVIQGTVVRPDGTTPQSGVEVKAWSITTGATLGLAITDGAGNYILVIN